MNIYDKQEILGSGYLWGGKVKKQKMGRAHTITSVMSYLLIW